MSRMSMEEAIHATRQRRDYLTERIKAKGVVKYDQTYDIRERDAHTRILQELLAEEAE